MPRFTPRFPVLASVALAALVAACASDRKRSFEIRTIDTEGQPVPCVVLVEGAVHPDPSNPELPLVTNDPERRLDLTFKPKDDGSYEVIELRVTALREDPQTRKPRRNPNNPDKPES